MEILFDPNLSYLLLVLGLILTLLAIVTPGTGLLEVGAVFCLALVSVALWQALELSPWALILLIISIVPFIAAVRTRRLNLRRLYLGLTILGVMVGSVYLFRGDGWQPAVNPILALVISLLAGSFVWFSIQKTLKALHSKPSHDLSELVGLKGEAKTAVHGEGSVQVAGELWSARSEKPIRAGAVVEVLGRDGFILVVREAK